MTSYDANKQIAATIEKLTVLRNELGTQLCVPGGCDDGERRRLSELHDRAARAIAAYHKG
ncbi:MAG: hypothetical protein ACRBB0_15765 [Pelagimonas sp.]|uniref:hypothetical protein n=1 Tax=Pelagimonas sp. TaxID=2073170 RepID=UPI003D6B7364